MKTTQLLFIGLTGTFFFFSGCIISDEKNNQEEISATPRIDLTTQTTTKPNGEEVIIYSSDTQSVKGKEAVIRTRQSFKKVEDSTLTIEKETTEVSDFIKNSTITIKNGGILKAKYVKNSKIIVLNGGDLQISERMKETEVILENGKFSLEPMKIDDASTITTK